MVSISPRLDPEWGGNSLDRGGLDHDHSFRAGLPHGPESADGQPICTNQAERRFLLHYALSTCQSEDALAFEAHLLNCEACFEDLKALDRAGALVRELNSLGSPALDRCCRTRESEAAEVEQAPTPEAPLA